jgi:hypothetical protein
MYKVSRSEKVLTVEKDGKSVQIQKAEGENFPEGFAYVVLGAITFFEKSHLMGKESHVLLVEPAGELLELSENPAFTDITVVSGNDMGRIPGFFGKISPEKMDDVIILRNRDAYMFERVFYQETLSIINAGIMERKKTVSIKSIEELHEAASNASGEEKEVLDLMLLAYSAE